MKEPFDFINDSTLEVHPWISSFPKVRTFFSTRVNGVSKTPYNSLNLGLHVNDDEDSVIENRRKFGVINKIPVESWICLEQVHETKVKKVSSDDVGRGIFSFQDVIKGVDGVYTQDKGIVLAAGFADCVPLLFVSPKHNIIGVAHAGWKGTVGNIVEAMVSSWRKEGILPEEIHTAIGPSICEKCYVVDDRVIDQVKLVGNAQDLPYEPIENSKYLLNLKELNKQLMIQAGILAKNIEMTSYCTSCQNDIFYSHRKENGKTGRMMAFITMDK